MIKDGDKPAEDSVKDTDATEKGEDRRKTLKKIGFGSAAIAALTPWKKPTITSVVLPAHAQTTNGGTPV